VRRVVQRILFVAGVVVVASLGATLFDEFQASTGHGLRGFNEVSPAPTMNSVSQA
jgi:hypothetical protein